MRNHTSPDDVSGMLAARGIVTEVGGATSHAAVVSRELGRPSVVGCGAGVAEALAGKLITIDGTEGEVREGILELQAWSERDNPDLRELDDIARRIAPLRAHLDGDHPGLGGVSRRRGAGGAGRGPHRRRIGPPVAGDADRDGRQQQRELGDTPWAA